MKNAKINVWGSVPPQILSEVKKAFFEAKRLFKDETCQELVIISEEEWRKRVSRGEKIFGTYNPTGIDASGKSMHHTVVPELYSNPYRKFLPNASIGLFLHELGHPKLNSEINMPSDRNPIYKRIARNRLWDDTNEKILETIKDFANDILDQWVDSYLISKGFEEYMANRFNWIGCPVGAIAETEAKSPESAAIKTSKIARVISLENIYGIRVDKQKHLGMLEGISKELENAFTQATELFEDIPNHRPSIDNLIVFTHNLINRFEIYVQKKTHGRSFKLVNYRETQLNTLF